jgi:antitoxin VapB
MAFKIKDAAADRLVRELAARTGETLTEAIVVSVRERLVRLRPASTPSLAADIGRIAKRCGKRTVRDRRTPDAILGYDDTGLPSSRWSSIRRRSLRS